MGSRFGKAGREISEKLSSIGDEIMSGPSAAEKAKAAARIAERDASGVGSKSMQNLMDDARQDVSGKNLPALRGETGLDASGRPKSKVISDLSEIEDVLPARYRTPGDGGEGSSKLPALRGESKPVGFDMPSPDKKLDAIDAEFYDVTPRGGALVKSDGNLPAVSGGGRGDIPDLPEKGMGGGKKVAIGAGALAAAAGAGYLGMTGSETELNRKTMAAKSGTKKGTGDVSPEARMGLSLKAAPRTTLPSAAQVKEAYSNLELPDQEAEYDAMEKALAQDIAAAQEVYQGATDRIAAKELWENIIQGVGLIAAGMHGRQTGQNMSGLSFDKTDWNAKQEAARADMRDAVEQASKKSNMSKERVERAYARAKDNIAIDQAAIRAAQDRDEKNADLQERYAARMEAVNAKNQELALRAQEIAVKEGKAGRMSGEDAIKRLQKLEDGIDDSLRQWAGSGQNQGKVHKHLIAEAQKYELLADELGIPYENRAITVKDLESDQAAQVGENRFKRLMSGANAPEAAAPQAPRLTPEALKGMSREEKIRRLQGQ